MSSPPNLQCNYDLHHLTTFGTSARAAYYVRITELAQLDAIGQWTELAGLSRLVLGGGSNLIFTRDFPGVVLHMALSGRQLVEEDEQFYYVQAAAGERWHDFVMWTLQQGWAGLENLSLIPGSVGAAPIQNIGAYGVEIKDVFHSLSWFEFASGITHHITDCQFAYRDSIFKQKLRDRGVIVQVTFALPKSWQPRIDYADVAQVLPGRESPTATQISAAICAIRSSKLPDPNLIGNAGSFFKNPIVVASERECLVQQFPNLISYRQPDGRYKLAAGWLIEQAGWKGKTLGRVGVYEKQALVLINLGDAIGSEVTTLAQAIQAAVGQKFGVQLEVEPVFV